MEPTVRVVIQARMRSSRLPGKILAQLAGRPILAHVARRLQAAAQEAKARWQIVVATTASPADDATERLCRELGLGCFRGPEDDVLARYVAAAADLADGDLVLRATADNPLYCPRRAALIVACHMRARADYTSIQDLSYVVPEVMRAGALRRMAALATDDYCREHVTPYFRRAAGEFAVVELPPRWQGLRPDVRLTVDTPAELRRMAWIFELLGRNGSLFPLEQVYRLCDIQDAEAA